MKTKLHLLLVTLGLAAVSAAAQVPGILSHQGKVTVNGTNYTGSGLFKFALVDATGTTTYWTQDGSSSGGAEPTAGISLPVARGIFSVNLGDTTVANMTQAIPASVFTNSAVYLRTWFNDGTDGSQLLAPDRQFTSVGYALVAASAGSVAAANIAGTIGVAQLPAAVLTNGASGVNLSGTFSGDGAGVTNVNLMYVNAAGAIAWTTNSGFVLTSTLNVGNGPYSVAAADVNGDGKLDLISANMGDSTLTVMTNNGGGVFGSNAMLTVGNGPVSVCAADVNGDGQVDLICANNGDSTLTVLTNNGSGVFGSNATLTVGNSPTFVVAADVNGDGKVDLICANIGDSTLTVLTNNGGGVFGFNATLTVGHSPFTVVAADVNGDGQVNLICANIGDGTLTVLTNNGTGIFGSNATLTVGQGPYSVAAADLNGDGKLDLISANLFDGTLTVLTNNGSGVFGSNASLTVGNEPSSVAAADVNGDGHVDLICANLFDGTLMVLTNNGSGVFGSNATLTVGNGPFSVAAADVNGDGHVDLVCADSGSNTLSVLLYASGVGAHFIGDGSGLNNLTMNAANLSGQIGLARLPAGVLTNNASGVSLSGTYTGSFSGDGSGLDNLYVNAANLTGQIGFAQLPAGVLLNGASGVSLSGTLGGTFTGDGSGLTGLNSAQLSGTISPGLLPASVLLNGGAGGHASGTDSTALGYGATASGDYSTAMGFNTTASGGLSTALGYATVASGDSSTAMGFEAQATNDSTFVWADGQGVPFTSTMNNEFSVRAGGGVRLVTGGAGLTVDGLPVLTNLNAAQLTGTISLARLPTSVLTNNASGVTLGGSFSGNGNALTNLNATNITGTISASVLPALNASNITSGTLSMAQLPAGVLTNNASGVTLSGSFSGDGTSLTNLNAQNLVNGVPLAQLPAGVLTNNASGVTLHGSFSGDGSFLSSLSASSLIYGTVPLEALPASVLINGGTFGQANGIYSTALGYYARANGATSTALGDNAVASGNYSTALGYYARASGDYSTALGYYTTVSGIEATAMGYWTMASSNYSTAMGYMSTASGTASTAMGGSTTASGGYSTALGFFTMASGFESTAMGYYAQATHDNSFVWADGQGGPFTSTTTNEFSVRAGGGVRFVTAGAGVTVDGQRVLANGASGVNLSGNFSGNGSGLTSLPTASASQAGALSSADWTTFNNKLGGGGGVNYVAKFTASGTVGSSALFSDPSGNVGIGANSLSYTLQVNGSVAGTSAYNNLSDARLKQDVQPIGDALAIVEALRGVTYNWNQSVDPSLKLDDRNHVGFLAQEVEKVLPQAVSTANDARQTKSVAYSEVIPVLNEAIKQQQTQIETLQAENGELKARLDALEAKLGK